MQQVPTLGTYPDTPQPSITYGYINDTRRTKIVAYKTPRFFRYA